MLTAAPKTSTAARPAARMDTDDCVDLTASSSEKPPTLGAWQREYKSYKGVRNYRLDRGTKKARKS